MNGFEADVRAFLEQQWIGRLATNGADGYPNCVPLWYMIDGEDVVIISDRKAAKVSNLTRDNRATLTVGGEPERGPSYMIKGRMAISDDTGHAWLRKITLRYESPEEAEADLAEWAAGDYVLLRLTVERVTRVF